MTSFTTKLRRSAAAVHRDKVCCLSPERCLGQRPALKPAHPRHPPLIFHPCAAWQEFDICRLYVMLQMAERPPLEKNLTLSRLAEAAGESVEWVQRRLEQQMQPAAGGDGSDCERTEA